MASNKDAEIYSYIGRKKSGKSYLALKHSDKNRRVIRIDLNDQEDLARGAEIITDWRKLVKFVSDQNDGRFKVCFRPFGISEIEAFHWVCEAATKFKNIAIMADEGHRYLSSTAALTSPMKRVIFQGRHSLTPLYYTCFIPKQIPNDIRGNTDKMHLFKASDVAYFDYLKERGATQEVLEAYKSDDFPKYNYALLTPDKAPVLNGPKPRGRPKRKSNAE